MTTGPNRCGPDESAALLAGAGSTPLRLERDVSPAGQPWLVHLTVLA